MKVYTQPDKIPIRAWWAIAIVLSSGMIFGMIASALYFPQIPPAFIKLLISTAMFLTVAMIIYILEGMRS